MPAEIYSDTKSVIIALLPEGHSMPEIQKKLKLLGKPASLRTIERVAQRNRLQQQGITPAKKKLPAHQLPVACCKSNIKIVDDWIKDPNPPTQREIARRLGISVSSVWRIFKKLGGVKKLKSGPRIS